MSSATVKQVISSLLESIQSAECQVREDGQKEYAHDEANVFANFDRVASALQLDRKQVLLVYALKHWALLWENGGRGYLWRLLKCIICVWTGEKSAPIVERYQMSQTIANLFIMFDRPD